MSDMQFGPHAPDNVVMGPKAQMADVIEASGIPDLLVPPRFEDPRAALGNIAATGTALLARSDHRLEREGLNGLFETIKVDRLGLLWAEQQRSGQESGSDLDDLIGAWSDGTLSNPPSHYTMATMVLAAGVDEEPYVTVRRLVQLEEGRDVTQYHANLTGINVTNLAGELDYSWWGYIPGTNVTMVADDALPGVYYVFACRKDEKTDMLTHASARVVRHDDEGITVQTQIHEGREDFELPTSLVQTYQAINKTLFPDSANGCPIIELQVSRDREVYFLQGIEGRESQPTPQALDPKDFPFEDGWRQADAVRGQLEQNSLRMVVNYPDNFGLPGSRFSVPQTQEACFDRCGGRGLERFLARNRKLSVFNGLRPALLNMATDHGGRLDWFGPNAAIALNPESKAGIIDEELARRCMIEARIKGMLTEISIQVASDGRTAFVRRDPDNPEPRFADSDEQLIVI